MLIEFAPDLPVHSGKLRKIFLLMRQNAILFNGLTEKALNHMLCR